MARILDCTGLCQVLYFFGENSRDARGSAALRCGRISLKAIFKSTAEGRREIFIGKC